MSDRVQASIWNRNQANFDRNLAVVIGIDRYKNDSICDLSTAVNDADAIATLLEQHYGYRQSAQTAVIRLFDTAATLVGLRHLLQVTLPAQHLSESDRLILYFAGHGLPRSSEDGPEGYLVPHDADPTAPDSFLAMREVYEAIAQLNCHHLLVILDCCFAGTFRWAGSRKIVPILETLRREHYYHFIRHPAWQVITSSAHDQEALDVARLQADYRRTPDLDQPHSPFALALLEGLQPGNGSSQVKADLFADGVVTAHELFVYLQSRVKQLSGEQQAPGIYPLRRDYDKGEFIFTPPQFDPEKSLAQALPLNEANNPYRGLKSFNENDTAFFFGRQPLVEELAQQLLQPDRALTVVVGVSGSGKSSLVKAGLVPYLRNQNHESTSDRWHILESIRPGVSPFVSLAQTLLPIANPKSPDPSLELDLVSQQLQLEPQYFSQAIAVWQHKHPSTRLLLVIDQFEELLTRSQGDREHSQQGESGATETQDWQQFLKVLSIAIADHPQALRLVLTLRSDFEPRFLSSALAPYWQDARFPMRAMTLDELRQAIENPALKQALYFEEIRDDRGNLIGNLVSKLVEEVGQMPGALPLLSFTLSELYVKLYKRWQQDQSTDRMLRFSDYQALGGVTGALTYRATEEYNALDQLQQATLRRVMLRMVAIEGEGVARRQATLSELIYADPDENKRVQTVIQRLSDARLMVTGANSQGESYVEPAHDALVQGWEQLLIWKREEEENILLQRRLTPASAEWKTVKDKQLETGITAKIEPILNRIDLIFYRLENWMQQDLSQLMQLIQQWQRSPTQASRQREKSTQFLWHTNPYLEVLHQNLQSAGHWLNQVESEFVQASMLQKRRNHSWRWRIAIGVILGMSILTVTALLGQRNALMSQVEASRESAEANFRAGQSLNAFLDTLRAARSLRHPLLQLFQPNTQLSQQVEGTLQKAVYSVSERNRLSESLGITRSQSSPDGQLIAVTSEGGIISLWNWQGQKQAQWNSEQGQILNLSFSRDGQQLATTGAEGTVRLWDLQGKPLAVLRGHSGMVKGVSFSPDGQTIATSGTDTTIRLWNRQGQPLAILRGHQLDVWSVAFSPDGQSLASASDDDTFRLWNLQGKQLQEVQAQQGQLHTIAYSANGQWLATAGRDGRVRLWTAQGQPLAILSGHQGRVWKVQFSADGQLLSSASADGTVRLWKVGQLATRQLSSTEPIATDLPVTVLSGHQGPARHVSFDRTGQRLVSSGDDGTVRFWDWQGQQLVTLNGHQGSVRAAQFSSNGQLLATSGEDATIRLWNLQGQSLTQFGGNLGTPSELSPIRSIAFSPHTGQQILASAQGQTIRLWSGSDQPPIEFRGHQGLVRSVQFSPDGQQLVSAGDDGAILLWNLQGQPLATWQGDRQQVWQVAFSPDGQRVASAGAEGIVRVWSLQGQLLANFSGHLGAIFSIAFSPNGQELASGGQDGTIRRWNLSTNKKISLFQGYDAEINSIAYDPEVKRLISGDSQGNAQLWNLQSQQQTAEWIAHPNSIVRQVSFSPTRNLVVTTADDSTAKLWQLENFNQLQVRSCALLNDYLDYLKRKPGETIGTGDRNLCDGVR
jgi:WD40 repeat protein